MTGPVEVSYSNRANAGHPGDAALHGEETREAVREDAECEEPGADEHEDVAAPVFDGRRGGLQLLDESFLADGDTESCGEQKEDKDHRRDGEGDDGRGEPAGGQRLPGQTGQDGPGSAEPGREVAEPEQRGAG